MICNPAILVWTSGLQNYERINFYCFKTFPNSQEFVSLVIGTSTLIASNGIITLENSDSSTVKRSKSSYLQGNESTYPYTRLVHEYSQKIVPNWRQPQHLSTGKGVNKLWHIYVLWNTTQMKPTIDIYYNVDERQVTILSKRPDLKKRVPFIIPFIQNSRKCRPIYGDRKRISGYLCRRQG